VKKNELKSLKEECYEYNMLLPSLGLVIYTFGNLSCVDRGRGVFAIKPSGVPYETMSWQDIVVLDFDCTIIDGRLRPSSDAKTHALLYRNFNHAGGIVHTHSTYATAWAQACRSVPIYGTTHADHLNHEIPCTSLMSDAQIDGDYETETGVQIVETFAKLHLSPEDVQMVLVASHGPFAWGESAEKAVYNSKVLEELCRMAQLTESLARKPERMKDSLVQKHYERKHGTAAYYGQEKKK